MQAARVSEVSMQRKYVNCPHQKDTEGIFRPCRRRTKNALSKQKRCAYYIVNRGNASRENLNTTPSIEDSIHYSGKSLLLAGKECITSKAISLLCSTMNSMTQPLLLWPVKPSLNILQASWIALIANPIHGNQSKFGKLTSLLISSLKE